MSLIPRWLQMVGTVFALFFFAAGCAQVNGSSLTPEYLESLDPQARTGALLQQPQVNDLYAAQLDHFSKYDWGDDDPDWGLLRVIKVTPTTLVVVTQSTASYGKEDAIDDLNIDLKGVRWDPTEEITLKRADLAQLYAGGFILEARRLTLEQAAQALPAFVPLIDEALVVGRPMQAILSAPQVDDILAARVDHFSEYSFGNETQSSFGLLRVVAVDAASVTVVTQNAAWRERADALDDLRSSFDNVDWDEDEDIKIQRSEFPALEQNGLIFGARRLTTQQIQQYLY